MRAYLMDMEVEGVLAEHMDTLRHIFDEQGDYDDGFYLEDERLAVFSGTINLYGGESEEEAHNRIVSAIKAEIPDCSVITRWAYLDDLPYEEYID